MWPKKQTQALKSLSKERKHTSDTRCFGERQIIRVASQSSNVRPLTHTDGVAVVAALLSDAECAALFAEVTSSTQ